MKTCTLMWITVMTLFGALVSVMIANPVAQAQTFSVLHNFTFTGPDGGAPIAGLTIDASGDHLYGTTQFGSGLTNPYGSVFDLTRSGSDWVTIPLHGLTYLTGGQSFARVIIGPDGRLYGTTPLGGLGNEGVVFSLTPPPTTCAKAFDCWTETVLYDFCQGGTPCVDGGEPLSEVVFDRAGNLYGTTFIGGSSGLGAVYKLTPSGGAWTETVIYSFQDNGDGYQPYAGLIFDRAGNLYGATQEGSVDGDRQQGGCCNGTVFQLKAAGPPWTERTLHTFGGGSDGSAPIASLIFDGSGDLFGTTIAGGAGNGGTAFELSPSGDNWNYNQIYAFTGTGGPAGSLVIDGLGNLYGTTTADGADGFGSAFRLTSFGGVWTYIPLHDFTGGSDGSNPFSNLVFDASGSLYGTTIGGGTNTWGVVFKIANN
jgi:uncharacterized repeat protein (TIGR03803 family)